MRKPFVLFLFILLILMLGACGVTTTTTSTTSATTTTSSQTTSTSTTQTAILPEVPTNVAYGDRIVTWNEVVGATSYTVKIGDVEHPSVQTSFTLPSNVLGAVTISVKATNSAGASAYSPIINVTARLRLASPTGLTQTGATLSWQVVANAAGYVVNIGGAEYVTTDPWYVLSETTVKQATIIAVPGLSTYYDPSLPSEALTVVPLLATPSGIVLNNGVLTWNDVLGASSYRVTIDETDYEVATTTLDLRYQFLGVKGVFVRALSATEDRLDSLPGSANVTFVKQVMPRPANPQVVGNVFSFDAVPFASGYDIYVNETFYQAINSTSFTIPLEILNQPGAVLQVLAKSALHNPSTLTDPIAAQVTLIGSEAELRLMTQAGSYRLTSDIVLTSPWIPLDFTGAFDGGNHTISGIQIATSSSNVGFFASLDQAVVRNVTLNGTIQVTTTHLEANLGGLAGMASRSTIANVIVQIAITATSQNGVGRLGGLVGRIEGSTIERVRYSGTIQATHFVVGGLIGAAMNPIQTASILQSSSQGSIDVTGGEQSVVGGFIGMMLDNSLTIKESFADMTTVAPNTAGGFVGYLGSGRIEDSYAKGSVAVKNAAIVHIGGFIGRAEGYNAKVVRCIAIVSVGAVTGTDVTRGAFVGRTPGGTYATIYQSCHYNSTVAPFDRIGNPTSGRGDGITGLTPVQLQTMPQGYSNQVWNFTGSSPKLVWEG